MLASPSPKSLKVGGWAALFEAFAYLFGFTFLVLWFAPAVDQESSPLDRLQFLLNHEQAYRWWLTVIYIFFGLALVPLVNSLYQLLNFSNWLNKCSAAFGIIWAGLVIASGMIGQVGLETAGRLHAIDPKQASVLWATIEAIQDGLGGGVEVVGGIWVLLVSILAWRLAKLTRLINLIGLLVGSIGVLTIIPGLDFLGAAFGLLQIAWFIGVGYFLLRS